MRSPRRDLSVSVVAVSAAGLALPAISVFAQSSTGTDTSGFPDLLPVAVWTVVTIVLALLVASMGYLYRRQRGMDHPLQMPPIAAAAAESSHDETRDAAGDPLPEHVVEEHAADAHDDATEQAKLLHEPEAVKGAKS